MPALPMDFVASGVDDFTAAVAQFSGPSKLVFNGDEQPQLSSFRFGQCRISRIGSPAYTLELGRSRNCAGMEDQLVVMVDRTAISTYRTGDVAFSPTGTTILIADRTSDAICSCETASERTIFSCPRGLLPTMISGSVRTPILITTDEGGMPAIFHEMVCVSAEQQKQLSSTERSRLQRSLVGLIGDIFATTITSGDQEGSLGLAALRARAVTIIEAELFNLQGVEDLSSRLGCSPRQIYKAFSERFTTPARYLWSLRLDRAREQIVSMGSEASITEIAYGCGFQSYSHFSRAYKKQFGVAPQACWNKWQAAGRI